MLKFLKHSLGALAVCQQASARWRLLQAQCDLAAAAAAEQKVEQFAAGREGVGAVLWMCGFAWSCNYIVEKLWLRRKCCRRVVRVLTGSDAQSAAPEVGNL